MSAYIVVEAVVTDPKAFQPYAKAVPVLVEKFGGEYLSLSGDAEVLEGDWGDTKLVLHRWPSMKRARMFWNSDEYQHAKQLREGTGKFRVMLIDGIKTQRLE